MRPEDVELEAVFSYLGIRSTYLENLVRKVVAKIAETTDLSDGPVAELHEARTPIGEAGMVGEDGEVYLDAGRLRQYEDDVAMALVAHELAHRYLGHHKALGSCDGLRHEEEADDQARCWGFNVERFRAVCGPPTAITDEED